MRWPSGIISAFDSENQKFALLLCARTARIEMTRSRALLVTFLVLSWLPGCFRNDSPPASNVGTAGEPAENSDQSAAVPKDLADLLKARGYVEVPLTLTKDPFFDVEVKINGQALLFILDTGTNATIIDRAVAGRLKLASHKTDLTVVGATGTEPFEQTESVQISVGPNQWKEYLALNDLSPVNNTRKTFGTPPCDGILGNDVMQLWGAVIDEAVGKLFLLEKEGVFSMPAGLTSKASMNTSMKEGRVSRVAAVEIPDDEAPVVSRTGFERLKPGMTFAQVGEILGGDLTKGRTHPGFTGTLAVIQGKRRIDLVFVDGKVTAKSAQGIDVLQAARNSAVGDAGIGAGRSSSVLTDLLKARGYVEVPLILNKQCYFDVEVAVNGQPLFFFLDTGSTNTDIDEDAATRLKLPLTETGLKHTGVGGSIAGKKTVVKQLTVGSISSEEQPAVRSFAATNAHRKKDGIRLCDGAIGNNFLQRHGAVIDHASATLFLRPK